MLRLPLIPADPARQAIQGRFVMPRGTIRLPARCNRSKKPAHCSAMAAY